MQRHDGKVVDGTAFYDSVGLNRPPVPCPVRVLR
jgi:hypothetical protein